MKTPVPLASGFFRGGIKSGVDLVCGRQQDDGAGAAGMRTGIGKDGWPTVAAGQSSSNIKG